MPIFDQFYRNKITLKWTTISNPSFLFLPFTVKKIKIPKFRNLNFQLVITIFRKSTVSDPVSPKSKNLKFQFDIMNIEGAYVDGMYRMFYGRQLVPDSLYYHCIIQNHTVKAVNSNIFILKITKSAH